ncbi:TetR/AcrR family transcriptional regulator [Pelagicoccus sp. SDUM812003]|uniref:TetR/AcrR family transcriptional regulator n=1 Tax=Pelagicoccus sp. SDUM812003 TaxID=3041267 RepID=UPI00280DE2FC|nr:TetR/AcrR family transcriptional regulator [Pelagicoccus sp. SDUM812003]MDQ8202429.1 TetR/AcrR family transcriptional regulator [Pelagicoccus sp. SDUM812003]
MSPVRQPEATRAKILQTAFELFHQRTFSGTSVNEIVEKAGITKGALFHHFKGKLELGYAVVDELLREEIRLSWDEKLKNTDDPITRLREILRGFADEMRESPEMLCCGCPVNNLTQEMSSIDDTFRQKLQTVYADWIGAIENALRIGIEAGTVRSDISPSSVAATIVAIFEGSVGLIKVHQTLEFMDHLAKGIPVFLEGLRP